MTSLTIALIKCDKLSNFRRLLTLRSLFGRACEQEGKYFSLVNSPSFAFQGLLALTITSSL